ncbi:MAG TPA: FIST N-terminal domain-containing protein [Thermoanaerobaculia bacterium]|nr:FIST N-terminal domain-containing protein [Thermoanaerobaculia bacterium]
MRSRTIHLPGGAFPPETLSAASRDAGRAPDFVLAFLPPDPHLAANLSTLGRLWPDVPRFGCEAVTQFADAERTGNGTVQLFWFDHPHPAAPRIEVEVIQTDHGELPPAGRIDDLARRLTAADGALLLADGLRFPAERLLAELRGRLPPDARIPVAGGLASQREPVTRPGARVFFQEEVFPAACLAVLLHGVSLTVQVVRGWTPASPVYRVTRAAGNVLYEIDGEPAVEWFRRFFTVEGQLAPMPESAYRFPLVLEGPRPERQGLYRSLRFFDQPPGALTFWGSIEAGDHVRLAIGNDASLVATAGALQAAAPDAAILYSCVGREAVLGDRASEEVAAIHPALGGAALSGFFTFGEIGPTPEGDLAFYNHTAVLVLLREVDS